ncbi:MAG: diacylglycerol kinase family protein [Sphingomicrobium sp.]
MKLPVLINPGGGSAGEDAISRVEQSLAAAGVDAAIEEVAGPDLAGRAAELAGQGAKTVVAAGGDGTLSAVGGALAGTKTALGILPLGTLNHLARDLGISFDVNEAAATLAKGHRRQIDVAELNGRVFVNNSAIGLYPLMVADREGQQERLGRSKKLAMLVASARALVRFHHYRLSLTVNDGRESTIQTPLLFVGNNLYRMTMPRVGCRDRLDDGRLSVMVARKSGRLGLIRAMLVALVGSSGSDQLIELDNVTRLQVASRRSHLTVSSDGETLRLAPPLDYLIRPKALWVIAPPSSAPSE